jgi:molybdate transport system substrate-binding protein
MGIAVRADTKPPLWASVDDFKQTLVNAKSIAYAAEGTSGKTFEGVLQKLGIFQAISDRLKPVAGGQTAISVANGEAQIGVIPVSTILEAPGVTLAGTFPSELHTSIDLSGGLSTEARHPAASHALLEFLIGPSADAILSAKGISRLKR